MCGHRGLFAVDGDDPSVVDCGCPGPYPGTEDTVGQVGVGAVQVASGRGFRGTPAQVTPISEIPVFTGALTHSVMLVKDFGPVRIAARATASRVDNRCRTP